MKQKLVVEFIGTFFLCLAIALNNNAGILNLIAISSLLTGLIYAGGHISGAHYNPAVTIAFFVRGRISLGSVLPYILVQVIGGIMAALLAKYPLEIVGDGMGAIRDTSIPAALIAEVLGTFALAYVILSVATSRNTAGNDYYGIAIGFTVLGAGYLFGPYSGAAFNPAVAISQSIVGLFAWKDIWVYLVACFGGGVLAAISYNFLAPER